MKIQHAAPDDLNEILSLQKSAYLSEASIYEDFHIPPLMQNIDSVKEEFEKGIFLKTVAEDEIVGSVRAFEKDGICFVGKLIVKENFQNRGIGKALMNAIEQEFSFCKKYELFTGHKSLKNIALYEKLGYEKFREQKINEKLTMIFMEKIR